MSVKSGCSGCAAHRTLAFGAARLNQPDDPPRFTPADMGVESGTNVAVQNPTANSVWGNEWRKWNGTTAVPAKQFYADVKAGKYDWGPTFQRINRTGRYESAYDTPEQRRAREIATSRMVSRTEDGRAAAILKVACDHSAFEAYIEQGHVVVSVRDGAAIPDQAALVTVESARGLRGRVLVSVV